MRSLPLLPSSLTGEKPRDGLDGPTMWAHGVPCVTLNQTHWNTPGSCDFLTKKGLVSPSLFVASLIPDVYGLSPFSAPTVPGVVPGGPPGLAPAQLWGQIWGRLSFLWEVERVSLFLCLVLDSDSPLDVPLAP